MAIELTTIGLIFSVVIAACLIMRPRSLVWVLSLAIPFSDTAMVVAGDSGVAPFWVVALVAIARLVHVQLHRAGGRIAGLQRIRFRGATVALLLFAVYGALITLVGPALFAGTEVVSPRGGLDSQIGNFAQLTYTTSNVAQLAYLIVGIGLVAYLIVEPPKTTRVIEVAIIVGFGLTLVKHFFLGVWPQAWFDSNPSYSYHWINSTARERGPFAEPSLLGMFLSMSLTYLVVASISASWRRRLLYAPLILVGAYLYMISYTGTGFVALGIIALLGVAALLVIGLPRASRRVRWLSAAAGGVVVVAVVALWDVVARYTVELVLEKLDTDSFANRTASNENSWKVFLESFGLGVGLGSDRPSSMFFMLLSCVGVVGALLFLRALSGYILVGFRDLGARPLAWALTAQIVAHIVARPDLSTPATWFLVAVLAAGYNTWAAAHDEGSSAPVLSRETFRSVVTWLPRELRVGDGADAQEAPGPSTEAAPTRRRRR